MNKILSLLVLITMLSTQLTATSNSLEELTKADNQHFYAGVGYGLGDLTNSVNNTDSDVFGNYHSIMAKAGYTYNQYISLETRYWFGIPQTNFESITNFDWNFQTLGLYVKPSYVFKNNIKIYSLLGFATSRMTIDDDSENSLDGFSYGGGLSYSVNKDYDVFFDYVKLYNNETILFNVDLETNVNSYNLGVSYKF